MKVDNKSEIRSKICSRDRTLKEPNRAFFNSVSRCSEFNPLAQYLYNEIVIFFCCRIKSQAAMPPLQFSLLPRLKQKLTTRISLTVRDEFQWRETYFAVIKVIKQSKKTNLNSTPTSPHLPYPTLPSLAKMRIKIFLFLAAR